MALKPDDFISKLSASLLNVARANSVDGVPQETAILNFATAIAKEVDAYIRTATVTVTALPGDVQVQGSPAAQANVAPLTFQGDGGAHPGGIS